MLLYMMNYCGKFINGEEKEQIMKMLLLVYDLRQFPKDLLLIIGHLVSFILCIYKKEMIALFRKDAIEMLRSILAQLQYKHDILEWEKKGVSFCSRLYVPEVHPITGQLFHEREDETHVFSKIKVLLAIIVK